MAKKFKRFFVFLFFSFFLPETYGRISMAVSREKEVKSANNVNTASAGVVCCPNGICTRTSGLHYCC